MSKRRSNPTFRKIYMIFDFQCLTLGFSLCVCENQLCCPCWWAPTKKFKSVLGMKSPAKWVVGWRLVHVLTPSKTWLLLLVLELFATCTCHYWTFHALHCYTLCNQKIKGLDDLLKFQYLLPHFLNWKWTATNTKIVEHASRNCLCVELKSYQFVSVRLYLVGKETNDLSVLLGLAKYP